MKNSTITDNRSSCGFTLVEVAIVLLIVGLMLGGMLMPLSAQIEQRNFTETEKNINYAKDALVGYVLAHGRLPCPATDSSIGMEAFNAGGTPSNGDCAVFYNGLLPAATLGITPVDSNGYAVDGWGGGDANRIRYAVAATTINGIVKPFTTNGGLRNVGIAGVGNANLLYICSGKPSGAAPYSDCTGTVTLTNNAVFVVYSVGKNAITGGISSDEVINPNPQDGSTGNDPVFVSHVPQSSGSSGGEFDDTFNWLSSSILIAKMVAAEQLP
jgi:prepilin-type N-terminal cleavage/methylation domain-containing protein